MIYHEHIEFHEANGVSVKQIVVPKRGMAVYQHVHDYEHMTLLTNGSISAIIENEPAGIFVAPAVIHVDANRKHEFIALEDNTILWCIHNSERQSYREHPMTEAIKGEA